MINKKYSIYLGKESEEGFSGFTVTDNLILVIKADSNLSINEGRSLLKKIENEQKNTKIETLDDLEVFLLSFWKTSNLPSDFSYAAGYINNEVLFLKTGGYGVIYIRREEDLKKIIDGENKASGYIQDSDFLIFTTRDFIEILGEQELKSTFNHKKPQEVLENLTPKLKSKNDERLVSLFLLLEKEIHTKNTTYENQDIVISKTIPYIERFIKLKNLILEKIKNIKIQKPMTLIFILGFFVLLFFVLISGLNNKIGSSTSKKIKKTEELVNEKLKQAQEVSDLNISRATILISDAKKDVLDLKNELKNKNIKDIEKLQGIITEYEKKIFKTENRNYSEFFDLSIENKNARADDLYKSGDNLLIFDKNGYVYILSLSKKSIDKRKSQELKKAKSIALYDSVVYFLTDNGIYTLKSDDKIKKIINKDNDWDGNRQIFIYNGNIYVLNTKSSKIFKYTPIDNGFSSKQEYIQKGQNINLLKANSFAIDGSIYVGFSDLIIKFTSGLRDGFLTVYPKSGIIVNKIFADKDEEYLYSWSKTENSVYVPSKKGEYQRQIKSSILKKSNAFVIYNKAIYVSLGLKIYEIKL